MGTGIVAKFPSLFVLSEFERINEVLFPLKSSEKHSFPGDFRGIGS